jgi:hypothetical protein
VAERLVVAKGIEATADTTHFKPAERAEYASVVGRVPVVSAAPFELARMLAQDRQQVGFFGVADEFKTPMELLLNLLYLLWNAVPTHSSLLSLDHNVS